MLAGQGLNLPNPPQTHRSADSRSAARVPDNLSATACISSSARMISASDILLQRRACSRRAPSQVVRLQSISWEPDSFVGIVASRSAQLLDIRAVLGSASFFLHADQCWIRNKADRQVFVQR